jgi:hypothetical protein
MQTREETRIQELQLLHLLEFVSLLAFERLWRVVDALLCASALRICANSARQLYGEAS